MPDLDRNDMVIGLSASEMPQLLHGHDSAAARLKLLPTCVESLSGLQTCVQSMEVETKSTVVYFDFSIYDPEASRRLPSPAPPPKLHYATFWRAVTRRICHKRLMEAKQQSRESAPQIQVIEN